MLPPKNVNLAPTTGHGTTRPNLAPKTGQGTTRPNCTGLPNIASNFEPGTSMTNLAQKTGQDAIKFRSKIWAGDRAVKLC